MELSNHQKAIMRSLIYSDIFRFPLTKKELWREIISDHAIDHRTFHQALISLRGMITEKNGFYCLKGNEKIISQRLTRLKNVDAKLRIASVAARILSFIPTVFFIGITGRLAHMDAYREDDIDMIFITKNNTLWSSRLLILMALEMLNVRRTSSDKNPKNKICPNLILDESALYWTPSKHDLYTAHEIIHIYPLFDRHNTFKKFINKNKWISLFYPNAHVKLDIKSRSPAPRYYVTLNLISRLLSMPFIEFLLAKLQKLYMRKKITSETIMSHFLAFHPFDFRPRVLSKFSKLSKKYNVSL